MPFHFVGGVSACTVLTSEPPPFPISFSPSGEYYRSTYLVGIGSSSRADLHSGSALARLMQMEEPWKDHVPGTSISFAMRHGTMHAVAAEFARVACASMLLHMEKRKTGEQTIR